MNPPGARLALTLGCSSGTRNKDMEISTPANDIPLIRNAQPVPTFAISRPARAGPIIPSGVEGCGVKRYCIWKIFVTYQLTYEGRCRNRILFALRLYSARIHRVAKGPVSRRLKIFR